MFDNIGSKIRQFRELKGYSQDDMASLLGITLKTYGNLERDNNKTIDIEKLSKIAKLLDANVEDFFELKAKPIVIAHTNNGDNNHSNSLNIYGTNFTHRDLAHALDKMQMENTFLKEKITSQNAEIARLTEVIGFMRGQAKITKNE
jgi:transcriptional regulator with XRE-family HTH domain